MQHVAEVEGIEAAGDAHLVELVLLDGDAPGAAPGQRAKPDFAVLLVSGIAGGDGEPGLAWWPVDPRRLSMTRAPAWMAS